MGELGQHAVELHRHVGAAAARGGVAVLIAVGPNAAALREGAMAGGLAAAQVVGAFDATEATAALRERMQPGDVVLIKGSRFMKLEQVVTALTGGGAA